MKLVKYALTIIAAACFCLSMNAQDDALTIADTPKGDNPKGAFNEKLDTSGSAEAEIPHYYRHHRQLPAFFTGYAIELTTSDLPLRRDYPLFEQFGKVLVHQLEEGGFSYLITGLRTEKAAQDLLDDMIKHRAPEATVVQYENGKRKIKK